MIHKNILNINYSAMVAFNNFYMGSILYYVLRHYVTAHPTALFSVVTRLNGFCRTRRFLQDSTGLADRTRRFLQDSTGFAVSSPFWPLQRLINIIIRPSYIYICMVSKSAFRFCIVLKNCHYQGHKMYRNYRITQIY